jgi:hypothetical protein
MDTPSAVGLIRNIFMATPINGIRPNYALETISKTGGLTQTQIIDKTDIANKNGEGHDGAAINLF